MRQKAWGYYKNFLSWSVEKQNQELTRKSAVFWEEIGFRKALETFHIAAYRVPAYKKFLREHQIDPKSITSVEDFKKVPPINKKNYLKVYPLDQLCWDGDLSHMNVISVSSGSTGEPFFWPRDIWQEHEVDHWYELTLRYLFETHKQHSLMVIAFAMGMYIAGPFTYGSCLRIAQKGYPLTLSTPSNDINAVLRIVKNLSGQFDQIILGGYPPLVKEILETGKRENIDWKDKKIKLFFGGEGFSEKWRSYVHDLIGSRSDLNTAINMYGTADSALLGIETPVSIAFRKIVADDSILRTSLGNERLPSMVTYNPLIKYFEVLEDRSLLFTSSSGIPLIRYRIGDVGGIIPYNKASQIMSERGEDLPRAHQKGKNTLPNWRLPIVYLYGRDDFTVHVYGANVYPENIKEALEDKAINKIVSGKFVLDTEYNKDMSPILIVKLELLPGMKSNPTLVHKIKDVIIKTLISKNLEYRNVYDELKSKAEPKVILESHGNEAFKINVKHRWVNTTGDKS